MLELKATAGRLESGRPLKCLRDEMEIVNAYELVAYTVSRLPGGGTAALDCQESRSYPCRSGRTSFV